MRIFNAKKNSVEHETPRPFVTAIIVAAGNSTRMRGVNKQFLTLGGVPVLVRALREFSLCPLIDEVVLAARESDIAEMFALVKNYEIEKVTDIVRGGETRQESVFAAIKVASPNTEFFAIHDGARPLVTQNVISDTVEKAFAVGAAATGVRVKDTIKVVNENGVITATPERASLWAVHTPQVFSRELYVRAAETVPNSVDFTDDCKLIEAFGHSVHMVEGSYENIKITTPEDILLAQGILQGREE